MPRRRAGNLTKVLLTSGDGRKGPWPSPRSSGNEMIPEKFRQDIPDSERSHPRRICYIHLDAAPGEKYAFPENLPCEEGFFCRRFLLVFFCREAANYSTSAARLPPSLLLLSKPGGLRKGP